MKLRTFYFFIYGNMDLLHALNKSPLLYSELMLSMRPVFLILDDLTSLYRWNNEILSGITLILWIYAFIRPRIFFSLVLPLILIFYYRRCSILLRTREEPIRNQRLPLRDRVVLYGSLMLRMQLFIEYHLHIMKLISQGLDWCFQSHHRLFAVILLWAVFIQAIPLTLTAMLAGCVMLLYHCPFLRYVYILRKVSVRLSRQR